MFQNSQTILRVFGIEIRIAASWLLIAALITWSLAYQVFPSRVPGLTQGAYVLLGVTAMLLFFTSLILHELSHAMVARAFNIDVKGITLFLFGGVAELDEEPDVPAHELWIALAGPAMSFALAVVFFFLSVIAVFLGLGPAVSTVLSYLAVINLVLAIFNLLPAFPLDGGRVLRAALWSRSGDVLAATETAARMGALLAYALIGLGILSLFQGVPLGGAWQILIGTFILVAARSSVDAQRTKSFLGNQNVSDVMSRNVVTAEPEVTLADLVNRIMLPNRVSFVPVVDGDEVIGHIDTEVLSKIDRENWSNTRVGDVFVAFEAEGVVSPNDSAPDTLRRFAETGRRKLLVVEGRQLRGVVTLSDMSRFLALLSELYAGRSRPKGNGVVMSGRPSHQ